MSGQQFKIVSRRHRSTNRKSLTQLSRLKMFEGVWLGHVTPKTSDILSYIFNITKAIDFIFGTQLWPGHSHKTGVCAGASQCAMVILRLFRACWGVTPSTTSLHENRSTTWELIAQLDYTITLWQTVSVFSKTLLLSHSSRYAYTVCP